AIEVLVSRRYDVYVWNRDPVRAHDLGEELGVSFLANLTASSGPFSLLVNATPLGLRAEDPLPCPEKLIHEGMVVIDAPYRAGGTRLSRAAQDAGARVFDGFALLLTQAAKQAELFTARATPPAALAERLPERFRELFEGEGSGADSKGLDL